MITLNLKEQSWKPYEGYGQYGYLWSKRFPEYEGYHVSIIDDVTKSESKRMIGLIHLSSKVRVIQELTYVQDVQYLSFPPGTKDNDFNEYPKTSLSKEDALKTLRKIFYKLQPDLQIKTLMGFDEGKGREYDPNQAEGTYLLNDEELYFITRQNGKITYAKGGVILPEYPYFKLENTVVLTEEEIDYPLYRLSLDYSRLKKQISMDANKLLMSGELGDMVKRFQTLEHQIDKELKNV